MENIFSYTKTLLGKTIALLTAIVVVMTFVDYLLKWQIYPYLLSIMNESFGLLYQFAFEVLVFFWLAFLSYLLWRLQKRVETSKPDALQEQIIDLRNDVGNQIKKVSDLITSQTKSVENRVNEKIFDIEYTMVGFEIDQHRSKNQVGEVSQMIKKLEMDLKRGWGAEDTLLEIKEYIKKSGMPSYFLDDLHKSLEKLPASTKGVGEETLKLAQERLYNPR